MVSSCYIHVEPAQHLHATFILGPMMDGMVTRRITIQVCLLTLGFLLAISTVSVCKKKKKSTSVYAQCYEYIRVWYVFPTVIAHFPYRVWNTFQSHHFCISKNFLMLLQLSPAALK